MAVMKKTVSAVALAATMAVGAPVHADVSATLKAGGATVPIEPSTAAAIIVIQSLGEELVKEKPFGPNNEVTKAVRAIGKALGF